MIKHKQHFGLSGEFNVIVKRADGTIRLETGMQPNLILDNGLKYYYNHDLTSRDGVTVQAGRIRSINGNCYVSGGR